MKYIIPIIILGVVLLCSSASAGSVVTLAGTSSPYELVYDSSIPREISTYQVVISPVDQTVTIIDVTAVDPFSVEYNVNSETGNATIAGMSSISSPQNTHTVLARVYTEGVGVVSVGVEVIADDAVELFTVDNMLNVGTLEAVSLTGAITMVAPSTTTPSSTTLTTKPTAVSTPISTSGSLTAVATSVSSSGSGSAIQTLEPISTTMAPQSQHTATTPLPFGLVFSALLLLCLVNCVTKK